MSLEDLYKDFAISSEYGVVSNVPVPEFSFPELPEAFTTDHDKANWKTLGDALNRSNGHVAALDGVVKDLVSADERFHYIGESVKWLKLELERMCEMPPLATEQSNDASELGEEEEQEEDEGIEISSTSVIDLEPVLDDLGEPEEDTPKSDETSSSRGASVAEGMFQPSDMYDWSEIDDDVHLLQEVIIMNPLMAIYEVLETKTITEGDLDDLFSRPMLADWDGEMQETLLDVLTFLSQLFLARHRLKPVVSQEVGGKDAKDDDDISTTPLVQAYPSPKMTDAHEIRVLELLPGSEDQPIQCLLTIEHLWDDPRYEALSYAWGSSAEMSHIELNKANFEITPNLDTALRHLRDQEEPRRLWVDALCINQTDPIEKEIQVKLMSEIYPAAENVLCWLGPEGDDSEFVMQRLQEIADPDSDIDLGNKDKERLSNGLFKLLSRRWWSRLWTCQEFALTLNDPQFICGKQCMSWSKFRLAAQRNALLYSDSLLPVGGSDLTELAPGNFWEIFETLHGFTAACALRTERGFVGLQRGAYTHPISTMAILTRRYQCADSRDKLFGILSFFCQPYRALLPPRYTQPAALVNLKYSAAILMVSQSGTVYNNLSTAGSSDTTFPSWAINFPSQTTDGEFDPWILSMPNKSSICASKDSKTQCVAVGSRLIIRGFIVDEIYTVHNVQSGKSPDPVQLYANLTDFQRIAMRRRMENLDPNNPTSKLQHLRTVDSVYNVITGGFLSDKTFHQAFERWAPAKDTIALEAEAPPPSAQVVTNPEMSYPSSSSSSTEGEMGDAIIQLVLYAIVGRKLFTTRSGFFGIGVSGIQEGDLVVILFGFDLPMILRKRGEHFTFVGVARVGGMMEGELMDFVNDGTLKERSFVIR
ncbi:heterokaryon incompatibility protein-domain-containing protein [Rhexocercosporidium sp. MPI-PUGE-AT-0058]|nr:heterokaryon incompatibility protein-domain-containing protein [Rhexocercosporidium sp. MPI-PUGE-AT-0058]